MRIARDSRGFTLLELLTVLVVLAVLCSLAAPGLAGFADRARTDAAIRRVERDLYWARMQAVRRGRNVAVRFAADPDCVPTQANATAYRSYSVSVANPAGSTEILAARVSRDVGRVCLEMNRSGELVFTSRGMLHGGQNRTLWVTRGSSISSLRISIMGRVLRDD